MIIITSYDQQYYRFYDTGTESGASALANENTGINPTVNSDYDLSLRVILS